MFNDPTYVATITMIGHASLPVLVLLLATPGTAGPAVREPRGLAYAQVTIHERIIVRVPRVTAAPAPPVTWKEKKGPHCIATSDLAGALITQPDAVDLVLTEGTRLRVRLKGACRTLDFYSNFYLKPAADGKICAGRDAVRARSGASCTIDRFRTLQPERARH